MPARHLLCVRHGLSTWNLERRWQGRADPPLSDVGARGAAELAGALATTVAADGATVWSSDLRRARDTAGVIAARLDAGPVVVDVRLREADVGPWQGLTSEQIEAGWPGYLATRRRPDGFEAEDVLLARALPALVDIAASPAAGTPIVVAHAGVLRAVRRHAGAVDERIPNLAGQWFAVDAASGEVRFVGVFDHPIDDRAGR